MAMVRAGVNVLSRSLFQYSSATACQTKRSNSLVAKFSTNFGIKIIRKHPYKFLMASVPLTVGGAGYYLYKTKQTEMQDMVQLGVKSHPFLQTKPEVPVSRKVKGAVDKSMLKLTLFQYPTCPFCCKVRAFLDYYGLPYDVVEVDPVLRQQTKWTTYKKVPILLVKVEDGYQQLNDSTMIISVLKSFFMNEKQSIEEIVNFYPIIEVKDSKGAVKDEIFNKYFLMYEDNLPKNKPSAAVLEEKKWREWADASLVHTLSPNVYRTYDEAMQAFTWFSEVGEWDRLFPSWERNIIVYVGASAMWLIGKRLKKRHQLKEDVRESLYDECRHWMKALSAKGTPFMGGASPNLADLAVYGVLSSIEGCLAFSDLLKNTKIGGWYFPMKEAVENHKGNSEIIHLL